MKLAGIQPSQLYISSEKLSQVMEDIDLYGVRSFAPVSVKQLGEPVIFTDGHTRALAALLRGCSEMNVYWDKDELDREAYEVCVEWCREEGIGAIADLKDRILDPEEYELLWLKRCREMQQDLKASRGRDQSFQKT